MISLETARELMERSRTRATWLSRQTFWLLLLGIVLGGLLASPGWLSGSRFVQVLLPQFVLICIILWVYSRTQRQRRIAAMVSAAWGAIQLKDWTQAEAVITKLLRRPIQPVFVRAQSLMALAAVAENQKQYDVSQHILETVLQEPNADASVLYAARVALAGTLLRNSQLTDAVSMIDKLVRMELPPALRAQVELLNLFRLVLMGQTQEAVAGAEERRALFRRHLSTRAGYGYALLSAAFDRSGQTDRAAELWRDATLLIRPAEIVDRFGEVRSVAAKYPSTEWPL